MSFYSNLREQYSEVAIALCSCRTLGLKLRSAERTKKSFSMISTPTQLTATTTPSPTRVGLQSS